MKNDINSFPLKELGEALKLNWADRASITTSYCESWGLKRKPWFIEQAVAFFPQNLSVTKVEDKYCFKDALAALTKRDPRALALWTIMLEVSPTNYIANMGKDPRYGSFTPNLLAGFKLYENIPYSKWTQASLDRGMSKDLKTILTNLNKFLDENKPRQDQLMAWRAEALGSGLSTKYNFKTPKDLSCLSKKEIAMLLQLWIAAPEIRSNLSILDPRAYDNMPEPIIPDVIRKIDRAPWETGDDAPPWLA